jgi:hypothetical protein
MNLASQQRLAAGGWAPLAVGVIGIQNIAPTIIAFGTPEQQRHLAPLPGWRRVVVPGLLRARRWFRSLAGEPGLSNPEVVGTLVTSERNADESHRG